MGNAEDKRLHKRIFFSKRDEVNGKLRRKGPGERNFQALILDISESGMGLTLVRAEFSCGLRAGEILVLESVHGLPIMESDGPVEMEIRWVLDVPFLDHIGFGCRFEDIPEGVREKIRLIVGAT